MAMRRALRAWVCVGALACGAMARGDADDEPASAQSHLPASERLRVGYYDFEPLVGIDPAGKPRGLYVDLLEHVARQEGWTLEWVHGTWPECYQALSESRVDVVPVIGYSEERARLFAFTTEFPVLDWGVVFTRGGSPIRTVFDLRGKKIGVLRASIYTQGFRSLLEQFGIEAEILEKGDYLSVFRSLEAGEVDAAINAQIAGATIAPQYHLYPTQIYFSPVRLGYASPPAKAAVVRALDAHFGALRANPASLWYELLARWLPTRPPPARAPRWLAPVLVTAGALLLVAVAFVWVLRRQVAARTGALRTANVRLLESQALLRTFSDVIPDPIFVKDREGRWLFANPAVLAAVGKRLEDVLGRTDLEIHGDPAVATPLMETDQRIMRSGLAEVVEERIPTAVGSKIYLTTKIPRRAEDGSVTGIIGSARDITDRVAAERALRESEHRFRALNEHTSDIVLVTDERGVVSFASPSLVRVTGVTQEAVVGVSCFDAVHPDDVQRMRESFASVRADPDGHREDELRIRRADGTWIVMRAVTRNLLAVPSVRGMVIFSRDVTDQRRAEEQLRQAQKLESIGRLAGGVAHDFNNLLTVILSCAASLADGAREGSPASLTEVEEIRWAGKRAADLTRQLLAFARKQVIAPVPVDLNAVVRGSEKLLRRVLGEDVGLVVSMQPDLWTTRCDPGQVEQVILNLAVNARDAMPRGGKLTIATENVRLGRDGARDSPELREGDYVRLVMRDSGAGMSPEVKAHLFEPFFTTKPQGRGTGLGLATVYGIVKQSDGHIRVESEPLRGTTVEVWLPRTDESARPARAHTPVPTLHGTERLLVVEDDAQVREVTVRSLRGGGYDVLVAASGEEALAVGAREMERVQLLVTDVIMPGVDGRSLVSELVQRRPGLRVLYVSGYPQDAIGDRGVLEDGVQFLPKPFTASELLAKVRAVLDARA